MCDTLQSLSAAADRASPALPRQGKISWALLRKGRRIQKSSQKIKREKKALLEVFYFLFFSSFPTCLCAWLSSCPFLLPVCFPAALCSSPVPGRLLESLCMAGAAGDEFAAAAHKAAPPERSQGWEKNHLQIFLKPQSFPPTSAPGSQRFSSGCPLSLPQQPGGWDEALPLSGWNTGW